MEDSESRRFGDLTVRIDRLICVGFGDCIEEAPGVFEFDDEGIATFRGGPDAARDHILEACRACPVDALEVFDQDGSKLHP